MDVELWPITRPIPYARNPRRNDAAIAKVAASIREFGWRQPIVVDEGGVIIAGHTRLEAARLLGLETVAVHVARGLTATQVKAYRLADNRVAAEAEWDLEQLKLELLDLDEAGVDLALTGFDPDELADMLAEDAAAGLGGGGDDAPAVPAVPLTAPGDRIELGAHVLVCGDATDPDAFAALLGDDRPDAVWTDPPYGVKVVGGDRHLPEAERLERGGKTIINDDLGEADLRGLLTAALGHAAAACRPGAAWYVAAPPGPLFFVFAEVLRGLKVWRQTLVWVKDSFVLGRSDYHYRHEAILYGWTPGAAHYFVDERTHDTVLEAPRPRASADHPTMKPLELVADCLRNSTRPGDVVLDPFGGSGTTLLACETLGRRARILELDPGYCDVIVRRWEELTGKTAERPVREVAA